MALDHSYQVQRHTYAERGLDLYETPAVAVEALLRAEKIPHTIWELAAGRGAIVRVLRDRGHAVIASDIHDYGFPLHFVGDFLTQTKAPAGVECVLTNPPFRVAAQFVAHALELCPLVIMFLPLTFLEAGTGKAKAHILRAKVLDGGQLARVHVFKNRLPMIHRDSWRGRKSTSQRAFAWFCWSRNHAGSTTISRISWER